MVVRLSRALALGVALGCSPGAESASDRSSPPLARLGSRTIDAAELVATGQIRRETDRDALLRAAVGNVLAAEEARARGLVDSARSAEIALLRARARIEEDSLLAQALFEAEREAVHPTEKELLAHHEQTQHRYLVRKMVLRRIAYASKDEAEAADRALGPAGRLDPAATEDIAATEIQKLPISVLPEATYLKRPGDRVVAGTLEEGFSLVELVDDVAADPRPFEEVRKDVERDLRTQRALAKVEALVEARRKTAVVEIDETALRDEAAFAELERQAPAERATPRRSSPAATARPAPPRSSAR
jgi:hypothetical protein